MELVEKHAHCITGFCIMCGGDVFPICDSSMFWSEKSQRWTIEMNYEFYPDKFTEYDYIEKEPNALGIHAGDPQIRELVHYWCTEEWIQNDLVERIPKSDDVNMFWTKVQINPIDK